MMGGEGFPPIDHAGYLRELARALVFIQDRVQKAEMHALLESHGWTEDPPPPRRPLYRRVLGRLRHPLGVRERLFGTEEDAVAYLLQHPLPLCASNPVIAPMQPVEVPFARLLDPHQVSAE
jgi:hypothetical protein